MISKKKPSVRIVTGMVKKINKGLKNTFKNPKTIATNNAVTKFST